jgi:hypothetical protein
MTPYYYLTEEIQRDQALVHTNNWRNLFQELKHLKDTLMNKLITLATFSMSMHNAQLDPLVIKGLCLALDHTYRIEDVARIREHCEILDQAHVSLKINTQPNLFVIPAAEDEAKKTLQVQILSDLLPIAQKAYMAWLLGKSSYHVNFFFCQALTCISSSDPKTEQLETLILKSRAANLLCTELLEKAFKENC